MKTKNSKTKKSEPKKKNPYRPRDDHNFFEGKKDARQMLKIFSIRMTAQLAFKSGYFRKQPDGKCDKGTYWYCRGLWAVLDKAFAEAQSKKKKK